MGHKIAQAEIADVERESRDAGAACDSLEVLRNSEDALGALRISCGGSRYLGGWLTPKRSWSRNQGVVPQHPAP
jgi:hypothetical protein